MNIALLIIVLMLAITSLAVQKSITSIIAFALMMLTLGIYYLTLHEYLLGLFQIFVYTGGISVLMLFGITLIGVEFPQEKRRVWSAFASGVVFVLLVTFFWMHHTDIVSLQHAAIKDTLFSQKYSDFIIIFALIGTSLLYGTIKMAKVLKRKKDV